MRGKVAIGIVVERETRFSCGGTGGGSGVVWKGGCGADIVDTGLRVWEGE